MGDDTQPQASFAELAYQKIDAEEAAEAAETSAENEKIGEEFESDEGTEEETEGAEEPESVEESEDADEDESEEDDEEPEDVPDPVGDDALVDVDGEMITVKELKLGNMRTKDYTKKRMADSETAKTATARATKAEKGLEGVTTWWSRMKTEPGALRRVLENEAPEMLENMSLGKAKDMYEESQLPEGEQSARRELRDRDRRDAETKAENDRFKSEQDSRESNKVLAERTANWAKWVPDALRGAGLEEKGNNEHNAEMANLVQERTQRDYGPNMDDWTPDQMKRAAKDVAAMFDRVSGKKKPKPKPAVHPGTRKRNGSGKRNASTPRRARKEQDKEPTLDEHWDNVRRQVYE